MLPCGKIYDILAIAHAKYNLDILKINVTMTKMSKLTTKNDITQA